MKKSSFLFVSLLSLTNLLNAQSSEIEYKNVVKVNPIGVVFNSVPFSYERVIGKKSSVQFNTSFSFLKSIDTKLSVILLGLDYKLYFSRDQRQAPRGFYVSPGVGIINATAKKLSDGTKISASGIFTKGVLGNQWVWKSGLSLDLFAGVRLLTSSKIEDIDEDDFNLVGTFPVFGASIGFNF